VRLTTTEHVETRSGNWWDWREHYYCNHFNRHDVSLSIKLHLHTDSCQMSFMYYSAPSSTSTAQLKKKCTKETCVRRLLRVL